MTSFLLRFWAADSSWWTNVEFLAIIKNSFPWKWNQIAGEKVFNCSCLMFHLTGWKSFNESILSHRLELQFKKTVRCFKNSHFLAWDESLSSWFICSDRHHLLPVLFRQVLTQPGSSRPDHDQNRTGLIWWLQPQPGYLSIFNQNVWHGTIC